MSRDITAKKADEEKIVHLSYHDKLRACSTEVLREHQHQVISDPAVLPFSMVVCDVNGLKLTNDVFGHQMGDRLLRRALRSSRVRSAPTIVPTGSEAMSLSCFPGPTKKLPGGKSMEPRLGDARKIGEHDFPSRSA